jgi:hypothetical protein
MDDSAWLQEILDSFPLDPLPGIELHDPHALNNVDLLFLSTLDEYEHESSCSTQGADALTLDRVATPAGVLSLRSRSSSRRVSPRLQSKRARSSLSSTSERDAEFADAADVLTPLLLDDADSFSSWAPPSTYYRDTPRFQLLRPAAAASTNKSFTSSSATASRFGSATSSLISECSRIEMLRQLESENRPPTRRRLF